MAGRRSTTCRSGASTGSATTSSGSAALDTAFNKVPYETAIRRARKAEALGLSYREYTLEILERGRYLQAEDIERIAEIKARRQL